MLLGGAVFIKLSTDVTLLSYTTRETDPKYKEVQGEQM